MAATSVNALAVDLSSLEGRFCHGNLKTENLFEVLNFLDAEGRTASTSKSKKKRRKARGGRQRTSSEPSGETLQPQSNVVDDKQKVQYLDKLTNIIAAKAKAEWRNQIRGFELLQKENEKLQMALKEKEKEFEKHKAELDIKRAEISYIRFLFHFFLILYRQSDSKSISNVVLSGDGDIHDRQPGSEYEQLYLQQGDD